MFILIIIIIIIVIRTIMSLINVNLINKLKVEYKDKLKGTYYKY
jgi:hypothetical protein